MASLTSRRIGRFRSLGRRAISSSLLFALATVPTNHASAIEPMTVIAISSVAITALQLGSKRQDITGIVAMETFNLVSQLHGRMDNVEETLSYIAAEIAKLPEETRKAVSAAIDLDRTHEILGAVSTTRGLVQRLQDATSKRLNTAPELQRDLRQQILVLRNFRSTAFQKSDYMVPAIVAALVAEVTALSLLPQHREEIPVALREYESRLLAVLDERRPGSLVDIRKLLEQQQSGAELAISKAIDPTTTKPIIDGVYPWFKHTLQTTVEREISIRCPKEISTQGIDVPIDLAIPQGGGITKIQFCPSKVQVDVDVHSHDWSRLFFRDRIEDFPDIYRIELSFRPPTPTKGGLPKATPHKFSDEIFQQPFLAAHANLLQSIATFNVRARAIVYLWELEAIAAAARTLVNSWNSVDGANVLAGALRFSSTGFRPTQDLELAQRDGEASTLVLQMKQARADARAQIAQARDRISQAIEENRRDQWRQDLVLGLQVFQVAYGLQQALANEARLQRISAEVKAIQASPKSQQAAAPNSTNKSNAPVKATGKDATPSKPMATASKSLVAKNPEIRTEDRIDQILREVDRRPAKSWSKLPSTYTKEELLLIEGLSLYHRMPQTDADLAMGDKSVGEVIADALKALAAGKVTDAQVTVILSALQPTGMAGGTGSDAPHRLWMHRQLTERLAAFMDRRFPYDFRANMIRWDPCAERPCFKAARP